MSCFFCLKVASSSNLIQFLLFSRKREEEKKRRREEEEEKKKKRERERERETEGASGRERELLSGADRTRKGERR